MGGYCKHGIKKFFFITIFSIYYYYVVFKQIQFNTDILCIFNIWMNELF